MTGYSLQHPLPLVVLISGKGSNLQAILNAIEQGLPAKVCAVISDKRSAEGLQRAEAAQVPAQVICPEDFKDKSSYEDALRDQIDSYQPELITLAGFMRILTGNFIHHFQNRILNIHPSLLPKYPGLNTHARALAAGDIYHGATVHAVTTEVDQGPIIAQSRLKVAPDDNVDTLKTRVQSLEHKLYPEVLKLYATGQLQIMGNFILWKGEALSGHSLENFAEN
jgi:phosphoribosylglycinamide formyltransferase-1